MEDVAVEAIKYAAVPIGHQLGYYLHYKKNLENFRNKFKDLRSVEHDIQQKIGLARANGEIIHQGVDGWLGKVKAIIEETSQLSDETEKVSYCLNGGFSSRYRRGKLAKKRIVSVSKILEEGKDLMKSSVADRAPVPDIPIEPFESFPSRLSTKEKIIEKLADNEIDLVGVYGMGGIGKTTLLNEVWMDVKKKNLFGEMVMTTVSQDPKYEKIQTEIAEMLGMSFEETKVGPRAARLWARLMQEKTILIIFDDIWEELNLKTVGIPHGPDHPGCKVVFTTRSSELCSVMEIQAKIQATIEVKVLPEKDSWELFRLKAGYVVDTNDAMLRVAKDVCNECKGLPLAIATLGKALRNKDHDVWVDVLGQLKKSIADQMDPVNISIKFSYDNIKKEETKLCFLFCCLFPEDHKITMDELFAYVMGENVLQEVDNIEEARSRLHSVVQKLIALCLLIKGDDDKYVMMHDIVRHVAITIGSKEGYIVRAGIRLKKWPNMEKIEKIRSCLRLSLMSNDICHITDQLSLPEVLTLSLANNDRLETILDEIFNASGKLLTLDLSSTGISSLPKSLSHLSNLQTLRLEKCLRLKNTSMIGCLKTLEILSLRGSFMLKFPEEIKGLRKLKLLDLSHAKYREIGIPSGVLSSLLSLEELNMSGSLNLWDLNDPKTTSLLEVAAMANLMNLYIDISGTVVWSGQDINPLCWDQLTKFRIQANQVHVPFDTTRYKKSLNLVLGGETIGDWVKMLLECTEELFLRECEGRATLSQLSDQGFNKVQSLQLDSCTDMECLAGVEDFASQTMFSILENLSISNCKYLTELVSGSTFVDSGSSSSLGSENWFMTYSRRRYYEEDEEFDEENEEEKDSYDAGEEKDQKDEFEDEDDQDKDGAGVEKDKEEETIFGEGQRGGDKIFGGHPK